MRYRDNGRNSLLITPQFGSLVWLGGVLTEAQIAPDLMLAPVCLNCCKCVHTCPIHALDGYMVDQAACSSYAFGQMGENFTISCHACRDVCPYCLHG